MRWNETNFVRHISSTSESRDKLATKMEAKNEWNRALSEAEKIVGYQTSFLSLRYLLSDEITNLALHMRKLIGSAHPLVGTTKSLIYGQHNMQTWGLIVLLVSKAAGHAKNVPEMEQDKSAGVLISQRKLAEVVEMIRTANIIHQGVFNLQNIKDSGNNLSSDSDMIFGNKIALLGGDYLLGSACAQIGRLKNQELNELICTAFRDMADSHFIGDRDIQNNPLPSNPLKKIKDQNEKNVYEICSDQIDNRRPFSIKDVMGSPENEWTLRHTLAEGTLLGKSCQSALLLAKQPEEFQKQAYFFGKHLSLAWQARMDLEPFRLQEIPKDIKISLISAPVLFHLEYDPLLYNEIRKGSESVDNINYQFIHQEILEGPGIEKTRELQSKHTLLAMTELYKFPPSDARTALENIIMAMQDN
ncbi:CLUMA_CG009412, isoform A [Clunio marinus]|uniref:CLUMA_CG009412, isoform A n=1 Tax=Clunio marinus TaxID=568069 RepID=A0A1J1I708_9DIPT|nr:CLUMA_CG009412, isoform A [Clunio marinus]